MNWAIEFSIYADETVHWDGEQQKKCGLENKRNSSHVFNDL
jgi:hypothetical protein